MQSTKCCILFWTVLIRFTRSNEIPHPVHELSLTSDVQEGSTETRSVPDGRGWSQLYHHPGGYGHHFSGYNHRRGGFGHHGGYGHHYGGYGHQYGGYGHHHGRHGWFRREDPENIYDRDFYDNPDLHARQVSENVEFKPSRKIIFLSSDGNSMSNAIEHSNIFDFFFNSPEQTMGDYILKVNSYPEMKHYGVGRVEVGRNYPVGYNIPDFYRTYKFGARDSEIDGSLSENMMDHVAHVSEMYIGTAVINGSEISNKSVKAYNRDYVSNSRDGDYDALTHGILARENIYQIGDKVVGIFDTTNFYTPEFLQERERPKVQEQKQTDQKTVNDGKIMSVFPKTQKLNQNQVDGNEKNFSLQNLIHHKNIINATNYNEKMLNLSEGKQIKKDEITERVNANTTFLIDKPTETESKDEQANENIEKATSGEFLYETGPPVGVWSTDRMYVQGTAGKARQTHFDLLPTVGKLPETKNGEEIYCLQGISGNTEVQEEHKKFEDTQRAWNSITENLIGKKLGFEGYHSKDNTEEKLWTLYDSHRYNHNGMDIGYGSLPLPYQSYYNSYYQYALPYHRLHTDHGYDLRQYVIDGSGYGAGGNNLGLEGKLGFGIV